MIEPYKPYEWDMERVAELMSWGLSGSLIVIVSTSLLGFTINKFIKLMLGRN